MKLYYVIKKTMNKILRKLISKKNTQLINKNLKIKKKDNDHFSLLEEGFSYELDSANTNLQDINIDKIKVYNGNLNTWNTKPKK